MLKLVVVIPAFNEEKTIKKVIKQVPTKIKGVGKIEIMVIDDGSTDRTITLAKQAGAKVFSHPYNKGVGAAFQTGIEAALQAKADLVVNMDGDGQFDPQDIPQLINPILEGKAEFVTASRFLKKEYWPKMPWVKFWGNRLMVWLINFITKGHHTDVSCGFRAYSREAILRLNLFGSFTYTQETFIDLSQKEIKGLEVALRVRGKRQYGQSKVARNLWSYTVNTLAIIIRALRDYKPLKFFGLISGVLFLISIGAGGFVLYHWIKTGEITPNKSIAIGALFLMTFSFLLMILALIADMLGRNRDILERILYYKKVDYYQGDDEDHKPKNS
jgi:glycosyltransferase involved in cell wall biosynthesis